MVFACVHGSVSACKCSKKVTLPISNVPGCVFQTFVTDVSTSVVKVSSCLVPVLLVSALLVSALLVAPSS
jgi:hypothetical protein